MATRLPSQLTYNDLNGQEAVQILGDWFVQLLRSHPLMQPHLTLPMAVLTLDIQVGVDMYVGGTVPVASPPDHVDIPGRVTLTNEISGAPVTVPVSSATNRDSGSEHREHTAQKLSTVVNVAPLPGGSPPDQVREQHDLPVPRPGYGPRDTGSHLFLADVETTLVPPISETGGRAGEVAEGYTFSREKANPAQVLSEQQIDLPNGEIKIDLAGTGVSHAGMVVKDDSHRKSKKEFGDRQGERYSSVNGVIDPGPAGLMNRRGGGGLGTDGRQRLNFGNNNRG